MLDWEDSHGKKIKTADIRHEPIGTFLERHQKVVWTVDDLIPQGGTVMWYGATGSHKSTAALHLAECVATAKPFFGHPLRQGAVLYVAAEYPEQFGPRHAAWCHYHGVDPDTVPIELVPESVDLTDPEQVAGLVRVAYSIPYEHGELGLVVIDPLSECHFMEENYSKDMKAVLRGVNELGRNFPEASILLVHHTGKPSTPRTPQQAPTREGAPKSPRGHSSLAARMDSLARVSFDKHSMAVTLTVEKMRVGPAGDTMVLPVEIVELGNGASGPVLVDGEMEPHVSAVAGSSMSSAAGKHEKKALAALATFGQGGARSGVWQKAAKLSPGTWQRTLDGLKGKGLVALVAKNYVVANPS